MLNTYAPLIKHARKFANAGFSGAEAEKVVAQGLVDGVFFGVPWVSNPDFTERLERGKKPNMAIDWANLYANGPKGYVDYPEID